MKINPGFRPLGKDVNPGGASGGLPVQRKDFSDVFQQRDEEVTNEQLQKKLLQIQLQGDRLAKSMTVRELRQYKLLIKKFLEDTVRRGVGMKDTKGWDRRGRVKRYKLLEELDTALLAMGEDMMENEQGRIRILEQIGEIRGLLINLLF